jgi:MinD-like ATPase involved in chromosome partitioning or flagellar assembly
LLPRPKLFILLKLRNKKKLRQSKEKFSTSFKKTRNSIIRWPECVPQLELHATERKPKVLKLPQSLK